MCTQLHTKLKYHSPPQKPFFFHFINFLFNHNPPQLYLFSFTFIICLLFFYITVPYKPTILNVIKDATSLQLSWSTQPHLSSDIFIIGPGDDIPRLVQTVFSGTNEYTISDLLPETEYTVNIVNIAGSGEAAVRSEPAVPAVLTGTSYDIYMHLQSFGYQLKNNQLTSHVKFSFSKSMNFSSKFVTKKN